MTPEQLDEIEKRWAGYLEKNEVERRFLFDQWWDKRDFWDMTKALREAREIIDHYERKDSPMFQAHLGEAKALMERDAARAEAAEIRKKRNADLLALEKAMDASAEGSWLARALDAERERDEARAEVERLNRELQSHDCTHRDTPGLIHCPIDQPCSLHRIERLREALKVNP